jgi:hypothetical protein
VYIYIYIGTYKTYMYIYIVKYYIYMTTKVYPLPCATSRLCTALFHSLRRQWLHLATGSRLELGLRGRHPRWRPCFWAISLGTVLQFLSLFFGNFCPDCFGSFVPLWGIFVPLEKKCPYLLEILSLSFGISVPNFWEFLIPLLILTIRVSESSLWR